MYLPKVIQYVLSIDIQCDCGFIGEIKSSTPINKFIICPSCGKPNENYLDVRGHNRKHDEVPF